MKIQNRKFRITAKFFTGAKKYFVMAVFASFITTISIFALIPILLGFSYTHYYTTLSIYD